ncbi:hybrid non-ribosomal peptide synthetase/type I polyketide synthase [Xenorhabdus hominickii]|uniref:Non-ribosomal peptide synthetase n=1 Tax=Xenorhabdus hominickii TaxID=351679 RepID=A0A2G0PYF9_XENHO|nr:hybrid non-ribosomal peptide synthetase/type I polyketide synthase [Xenorhabdus hominickii]AOM39964.1 non-ribosomal peptide synthetase [Xenorhabdus hominickii]PHM51998.1 yersiniabactin biosynthetic protein [Xenorhabdus hominickii]PHM52958.1 yersiniabactin biosynthetic protein [Xenorhabdus hominickii]PHM53752.1 yersiniabactin biosynthetic protein [Xenorhabdus hominickii]
MTDLTPHYDNCDPIAVIGLACRFPQAPDSDIFWHNLQHGVECTTTLSRQTLLDAGIPPEVIDSENFVNQAAILENAEQFDATLFGYSRQEAEMLDPQQRLFLQTAWHALEHAGYSPRNIHLKTGVFGSSRVSTWPSWSQFTMTDVGKVKGLQALMSNDKDYLATRTAYKLNLKGPALTIQTACSSSLVAVHMACENLRSGECDMALAGGVAVSFPQESGYLYQPGMIFSPDGHCRPFDSQANGTYGGNGVGVVTLKRLSDALRDGDPIMAVLRGSAINNDGNEKVGFTAPSVNGQRSVITEALQLADISVDDIGMIEAHGTGTPLGDPIEVDALRSIFCDRSVAVPPCYLGSVKSNIGHLDTAAGIASLIKAVLSVWHGYIPPTINVQQPNPALRLEQSPFKLATQGQQWPQELRTAGVSSFGIGGTNCHIVVQSLPEELHHRCVNHSQDQTQTTPLLLSAASESSLCQLAQRYATALTSENHAYLAWTALQGRDLSLPWRLALTLTPQDAEKSAASLSAFANHSPTPDIFSGQARRGSKQLWQFSGQGCQWSGMGKVLYASSPVFSAMLDRCCIACASELTLPLKAVMFGEYDAALATTEYAQPAIVAHQIALAAHWRALGLKPDYVLGHSVGEFAAAVVAGIFTPEQVMPLVAVRGKLMQKCAQEGAMLAVFANEDDILPLTHSLVLDLAVCNGPQHWVWAGTETEINTLAQRLEQQQIRYQRLNVACAAHSAMLEPILEEFSQRLSQHNSQLQPASGEIPLISTLTANIATSEQLGSPDYWRNHMRQTVRYHQAIEVARQQGVALFVEFGADAQLTGIGRRSGLPQETWVAGAHRQSSPETDQQAALMQFYCAGAQLDWQRLFPFSGIKCHAPLYPFDKQHYSFAAAKSEQHSANTNVGLDVNSLLDPAIEQNFNAAILRALYTDALIYQCHGHEAEQGFSAIDTIRAGRLQPCWRPLLEQLLNHCVQQGYYQKVPGPTVSKIYRPHRVLPYAKRRLLEANLLTDFPALIHAGERLFALMSDRTDLPRQLVVSPATTKSWLPAPQPCPDTHYALNWCTINTVDKPNTADKQRSSTAYTLRSSTVNGSIIQYWRQAGIDLQPESENTLLLLQGHDVVELCDQVIRELKRDEKISLTVVTCCAQSESTLSKEDINPAQYAIWALLRVAVEEYPHRRIQAIDIADINDTDALSLAFGYLDKQHRWLRVRGNQVATPILQRQPLPLSQQPMSIPHRGWHIVTGGMGGIGQISIRWLLTQGARKIAVFARRKHAEWDAVVQELSLNTECEIRWINVDVTDTPALLNAVQTLAQEDGIAGAIHATGIADHTPLAKLEHQHLSQMLAVKAQSALTLQSVLQQHNAQYLLLHSSAASMLGAQGQGAYAIANACLESLALTATEPLMVKTLVWGVWGGIGMASDRRLVEKLAQDGMLPFSVNEGIWHLNQSLHTTSPCYLAMRLDEHHPDILRRLQTGTAHTVATSSLSAGNTLYQDSKQRLNWLRNSIATLLRLEQPESLEPQQDLLQFGLDSLLFLELNTVIHQQFGFRLTAELAYQNMTLEGINALIGDALPEHPISSVQSAIMIDSTQHHEPFPLTPIQHAYWIGRTQAIDFGGVACHVLFEWDLALNGFDILRFEKAWNALIQRHGMLRMIVDEDGQQKILPETPWYALSQDDLRTLDDTTCEQALSRRRHALSYQVPPAEQWPLFEVSVSLLPNECCRLHMNLDLLQFDVQSFRIMMDDLQRAYHQQPLAPQAFTFRDYVMTEQAQRESKEWRASWAYWQEQLLLLPPAPRLPLNPQLPQRSQPQFTTYEGRLAQSDWQRLKQSWKKWGVTPSAGLLTLFAHTLEWYSRHPLFTLNLTFFNRQPFHPEVQELIGDFTSVMLMDFDLRKTTSLRASMEKTQALLWQRLSHSHVNGVEVLRELGRLQNGETQNRQPLTPVVFTSMLGMAQEGVAIKQSITQLLGDPVFVLSQTPQVWLDHQVMEVDGELLFNWYCMDDVLEPGVIEALFAAYNALLMQIIQICHQPERLEHHDLCSPPAGQTRYDFWPQHPEFRQTEQYLRSQPEIRLAEIQPRQDDTHGYNLWLVAEDNLSLSLPEPLVINTEVLPLPTLAEQQAFEHSWQYIEQQALLGLGQTLLRHNLFSYSTECHSREEIEQRLQLAPQYQRLLAQWLALLSKQGFIEKIGDGYRCLQPLSQIPAPTAKLDDAVWCQTISRYIATCIEQHDPLLAGRTNALELLFADKQTTTSLYSENPALRCLNQTAAEIVRQLSQTSEHFTVLEVGAGTGATSERVLQHNSQSIESYHFTDVSPLFLDDARQLFNHYGETVKFALFDINQRIDFSQHPESGYDLIMAVNVLHDAIHLRNTLKRLSRLLKSGGWLLIIESTKRESAMQLASVGFIEGINAWADDRGDDKNNSALLELADWRKCLEKSGYRVSLEWPGQDGPELHQQLILARAEQQARLNISEIAAQFSTLPYSLHIQQQEQLPLAALPSITLPSIVTTKESTVQPLTTEAVQPETKDDPLHDIEQQVIALWSSLLPQLIQRHSDFFQSGGDSLIATRMIVQLRRQGYKQANLQQLFEHPKLSEFCRTLRVVETNSVALATPHQTEPASEQMLPLTPLQYAYWLGESQLFQFGNGIAHFYAELAIDKLDLPRFTAAWNRVINHHAQLRGYVKEGQYHILPEVPCYTPTVIDCRNMIPNERETQLNNARETLRIQGVPSNNWPLFDLTLYHTDDRTHLLHLTIDLLVADGKSLTLILRDLHHWYQQSDWQPEPPTAVIGDYIQALENEKTEETWQQSRQYWLDRLPSLPDAPVLPLKDHQSQQLDQQCLTGYISPQQWQCLQQRAAEHRVSPSQVMLTLFAHVLSVWSNSEHFTINVLHGNRLLMPQHCDMLVGNLSTTSLLEVDLRNITGFNDAINQIQKQWLADLQHALFDGQLVLREKNQHRHNLNAGMPIVFNDTTGTAGKGPSGLGTLNLFGAQTPHVYLDCMLISGAEGSVTIQWAILPQLFQPQVAENMFAHYQASIVALLEPDYQWSTPLPEWLPANDRALCQNSNATKSDFPPHTLCSLIEQAVNRYPQHTAVVDASRQIDYRTLWSQSLTLAAHLQAQENQDSSLIGIVMEKGWEQVVAVIAILLAGRAYLPIDASYPQQRIHQLLASGKVDTVLTQPKFAQQMGWPDNVQVLSLDETLLNNLPVTSGPRLSVQPEDLAYVIFTSGSTGKPKGVMIDHQGAVNTIIDINQRIALNEHDSVLAISELTFDLSVYDLFGTLSRGAKLVMPSPGDSKQPDKLLAWLQQELVTVWNSVPAFVQLLEEYALSYPHSLNSLRWILMSGDWIPTHLPAKLHALHPALNLLSLGGATEASIWSIAYPITQVDPNWRSIPYGKPLDNQTFYVLNAALSPCPVWVTGELYIGGQGLALGYWTDTEKTELAFITHPQTGERLYRTGDLGRWRPDGNIEFLGRNDHQIKIRGYRIELGEIEHRLCEHPAIQQALVFAHTTPTGALQLVAGLRLTNNAPISTELLPVLPHWLQQTLPVWMCPQRFVILDTIPVSDNGKIDRRTLATLVEKAQEVNSTPSAALSTIGHTILSLWESVLEQQGINVHESFFTLGGDSLAAVRLMVKINQTFNRQYPLSLLQTYDTVHSLAEFIEHQPENTFQSVILNEGNVEQPALFIVHPIGGHLLGYRHLAANFGDQRLIGLAFSPDNLNIDKPSVAALAADYINQIRTFQPKGPYTLAGWSFGGLVAYEMAHQLRVAGEHVSHCILIDSFSPNTRSDLTQDDIFCHRHFLLDLQGQFPDLALDNHAIAADTETFLQALHEALPQSVQIDGSLTELYTVWHHNLRALLDYCPPQSSQPFSLIRAMQALPDFMDYLDPTTITSMDLGWQAFGPVNVTQLDGNHYSLFQHKHVSSLVMCLKNILCSVPTIEPVKENI